MKIKYGIVIKFLEFVLVTSILTGCSFTPSIVVEHPQTEVSYSGVVDFSQSIKVSQVVADVLPRLGNQANDPLVSQKLSSLTQEYFDRGKFSDLNTVECSKIIDLLSDRLKAELQKNLSNKWSYILHYNSAFGKKDPSNITANTSKTQISATQFRYEHTDSFIWYAPSVVHDDGNVKMQIGSNFNCSAGKIDFVLRLEEYSVQTPKILLAGQKIATLNLDLDGVNQGLQTTADAFVGVRARLLKEKEVVILADMKKRIASRYKNVFSSIKTEKTYNLTPDVIASRIQRKLDAYKYVQDRTRYEFSDKKKLGLDQNIAIKTIVNVFPESKDRSAVAFELQYQDIADTFNAGRHVFGEKAAEDYLKGQQQIFENLVINGRR